MGITDIQPRAQPLLNITTSAETADSYFDFDMEPESPGSPIDECEYTRLIETTVSTPQEHQAPESGFVCASPCSTVENESRGSASSSDAQFFDPENSSDTGTEFFDCPNTITTEYQTQPHALPARPRRVYHHLSHNKIAVRPPSPIASDDPSSSSSSATPIGQMNGHVRLLESGDSDESLPPSQSTTSNSNNLNCDETNSMSTANSNSNSTLQDADGELMPIEVAMEAINLQENENTASTEEKENDEIFTLQLDECETHFVKNKEDETPDTEIMPPLVATSPEKESSPEINEPFNQDGILSEIQKECNTEIVNTEEVVVEEKTTAKKDSDEESDSGRVPRIRRCSSLKTGKTPPGTPGRKKSVRFADILGLDLADVRTFLDEVPKVPKSAYEDLDVTLPNGSVQLGPPLDKVLVPLFQQPGCLPNFLDRLRDTQVCLESAAVTDVINLTITGCARVRNLDFHKSVHLRYSLDNWRSYSDLSASYVENSCDGFSDKFSFILFGNSLQIGQRLEMAIRFQAKGEQFWDNNYGLNYCFQCLPCNTLRTSPIMASDSSLSSSDGISSGDSNSIAFTTTTSNESSSTSITSNADALGQPQWSNSFLY